MSVWAVALGTLVGLLLFPVALVIISLVVYLIVSILGFYLVTFSAIINGIPEDKKGEEKEVQNE